MIGKAASEIRRGFSGESAAGGLACEAMCAALGADVAIVNQTTVRGGFASGAVTRRDVYQCVPFQNELVALTMTGAVLRELVEYVVGRGGDPNAEVAGLSVRYDPRRPRGERVVEALVRGAAIDPARSYRLATTDFYIERVDALAPIARVPSGMTPYDALVAYFVKRSPVAAAGGRRLVSLAPAEPRSPRGQPRAVETTPTSAPAPAGEKRP